MKLWRLNVNKQHFFALNIRFTLSFAFQNYQEFVCTRLPFLIFCNSLYDIVVNHSFFKHSLFDVIFFLFLLFVIHTHVYIYIYIYIYNIYIYTYIYLYMNKKTVGVCVAQWQLKKKHKVCLTIFHILLILSHICESYKLTKIHICRKNLSNILTL